jgi:hypothetical protein
MRSTALTFIPRSVLLSVVCSVLLGLGCLAQVGRGPTAPDAVPEDPLRVFLRSYLRTFPFGDDPTTRYSAAVVDLSGSGKNQAIVYVTGRAWCGTGGCVALILTRSAASYRVVTKLTVTWPPIRVLRSASRGWRSIAVRVAGGGIRPGYEAELRFDGATYPSNPSAPPARRLSGNAPGDVALSGSEEGTLLYP